MVLGNSSIAYTSLYNLDGSVGEYPIWDQASVPDGDVSEDASRIATRWSR